MSDLKSKLKGQKMIELEARLAEYDGEDKMVSSVELAKIAAAEKQSDFRFPTGIRQLDAILNGTEAGELIIVTGPTGHGKSTLLMSITKNLALTGITSAWFELELTQRQFFRKFNFEPPVFYHPQSVPDKTIPWLEERILEAVVKYNIRAVFIDDLHHLFALAKMTGNMSFEIGDIIHKLKDIAIENNLTIFLQVHIKDPQDGAQREPLITDIRDSGLIKATADTVLAIWRVPNETITEEKGQRHRMKELERTDTKCKIRVWKNRREGWLGGFYAEVVNNFIKESFDEKGYPTGAENIIKNMSNNNPYGVSF